MVKECNIKMRVNIFIGFQYDYENVCFAEYIQKKNNFFYKGTRKNNFANKIQKLYCCESVNKYINLPFKSIWFSDFSELDLGIYDNICFIFSKSQSWLLQYKNGMYIKQLRSKYLNCKIILYSMDLISIYYKFNVSFFKMMCDAVLTYDLGDSEKYGITYCPLPYHSIEVADNPKIQNFDVYFCGSAKNRLQDIFDAYLYFKQNHLKCCFFIMNVPREKQKYKDDIIYNRRISYYKNLQYVQKAWFLLDIVQKGSRGDTLRIKEAVTYGKKIVTNNSEIRKKAYFSKKNICVFSKVHEISKEFISSRQRVEYEQTDFNEFEYVLEDICNRN